MTVIFCDACTRSTSGDCGKHDEPIEEEACARVAEAIPVPVGGWPEIKRSGRMRERTAAAIRAVPLPDGEKEPTR